MGSVDLVNLRFLLVTMETKYEKRNKTETFREQSERSKKGKRKKMDKNERKKEGKQKEQ